MKNIVRRKRAAPHGRFAFTLIELLVVLATLAVLAALLLPAMAASKEKSPRAQCVSNLHEIWLATQLYADENRDQLPHHTASGTRLWDLPKVSADVLTESGARKRIMYCPSSSNFEFIDPWWNFTSTRRVVGYSFLFKRAGGGGPGPLTLPKQLLDKITQPMTNGTLAESEYVTDAVISDPNPPNRFDLLPVSSTFGQTYFSSSHMQGRLPAGGNILFLDGHVAWRPFDQMHTWYNDFAGATLNWWF